MYVTSSNLAKCFLTNNMDLKVKDNTRGGGGGGGGSNQQSLPRNEAKLT